MAKAFCRTCNDKTSLCGPEFIKPQSSQIILSTASLLQDPFPPVHKRVISVLLLMFHEDVTGRDWRDKDTVDVDLPTLLNILKHEVHPTPMYAHIKFIGAKKLTKLIQIYNPLILTAHLKVILDAIDAINLLWGVNMNDLLLAAELGLARVAEVSPEKLCTLYFNKFDRMNEHTRTFASNHC